MSTRAWIALLTLAALAVAALGFALRPGLPGPAAAGDPLEQNAAAAAAAELEREYEALRRSAELNAQLAADERNMQINMSIDELNMLAQPLPVEEGEGPSN
ncbi:MAG TPA: hypothetical protein VF582_02010 [Allosphingosinicella sp.]|jgi:hypothetical protein